MGSVYVTSPGANETTSTPIDSVSGVTVEDLLAYVNSTDTAYANECLHEAWELIYRYLRITTTRQNETQYAYYPVPGDNTQVWYGPCPPNIMDRVILDIGSELFHRKNAPSGIQQFASYDGVVPRLTRDPMSNSYPILQKYVVTF